MEVTGGSLDRNIKIVIRRVPIKRLVREFAVARMAVAVDLEVLLEQIIGAAPRERDRGVKETSL